MDYLIAAVAAILGLGVEARHQRLWFAWTAVQWWIGRFVLEVAAALAGVGALKAIATINEVDQHLGSIDSPITWVVVGLATPRLVRAKPRALGRNLNLFAPVYARFREPCNAEIDEASSDAQGQWVQEKVKPAVASGDLTASEVARIFRENLDGQRLLSAPERAAAVHWINEVLEDDATSEEEKVGALVLHAKKLRTYRSMKRILKSLPSR